MGKHARAWVQAQLPEILNALTRGESYGAVTRRYGISQGLVYYYRTRAGLPPRQVHQKHRRSHASEARGGQREIVGRVEPLRGDGFTQAEMRRLDAWLARRARWVPPNARVWTTAEVEAENVRRGLA